MSNPASPPPSAPATRAEKLSILSALLGPDALARLREGQGDSAARPAPGTAEIDTDRAAWHQNKLLERLRGQARSALKPKASAPVPQAAPPSHRDEASPARRDDASASRRENAPASRQGDASASLRENAPASRRDDASASRRDDAPTARPVSRSLDARLVALAELETLADEHPAIIARLMTNLTRAERITALKFLPGPVARVVLARLR